MLFNSFSFFVFFGLLFCEQPKYNKQYFRDGIHFNDKGKVPSYAYLKDKLAEILRDYGDSL